MSGLLVEILATSAGDYPEAMDVTVSGDTLVVTTNDTYGDPAPGVATTDGRRLARNDNFVATVSYADGSICTRFTSCLRERSSASTAALHQAVRGVQTAWRAASEARTVRLVVDVDPVSML